MASINNEKDILEMLAVMSKAVSEDDWKGTLGSMVKSLREVLVFDNLAVYVADDEGNPAEAIFARSMGRGKFAEADASWGETIMNQVMTSGKVIRSDPDEIKGDNRVLSPYVLGLPLNMLEDRGVLILIRFGGPQFTEAHVWLAEVFTVYLTNLLDRNYHKELLTQLQGVRYQTQLQDDFIATISHEFNTPLGFIKGYTTSLLRPDATWKPQTVQEFLTIIDEETDQLINLIGQMLDSARLKYGKLPMDFQPLRLDRVLVDLVTRVQSRKKDSVINLEHQNIPFILGDPNRITQVFENLIGNALKYAPGSPILIQIRKGTNQVEVVVSDQGPGIPEEHIPYLFERFYRVPNQVEKRGTGLGLFICREIVLAHHGNISVKNGDKGGTEFHIEFPVYQPKIRESGPINGGAQ